MAYRVCSGLTGLKAARLSPRKSRSLNVLVHTDLHRSSNLSRPFHTLPPRYQLPANSSSESAFGTEHSSATKLIESFDEEPLLLPTSAGYGYAKVAIGDTFTLPQFGVCRVVRNFGWGMYATVWLVQHEEYRFPHYRLYANALTCLMLPMFNPGRQVTSH